MTFFPRVTFATLLTVLSLASAQAVTIDLRSGGGAGGGYGNALQFGSGGINVSVRAFAETGIEQPASSGYYRFESAEIWSWSTGLGVCNRAEGTANSGCDNNEHEVDTVGRDDLVVFFFDRPVNFRNLTVDPYDGPGSDPNDRDITYWIGNVLTLPDFTTRTFGTLNSLTGFSTGTLLSATSGYSPFTHILSGTGNVLLLSGNYLDRSCVNSDVSTANECEAWKVSNLNVDATIVVPPQSVVPLPGALWLFLSGLALLHTRRQSPAGL